MVRGKWKGEFFYKFFFQISTIISLTQGSISIENFARNIDKYDTDLMESSWKGVIILQYSISLHSLQSKNKYQLFLPNSSTPLSNCIVDALLNHIPLNVSFFAISVHLIIKFSDAENA